MTIILQSTLIRDKISVVSWSCTWQILARLFQTDPLVKNHHNKQPDLPAFNIHTLKSNSKMIRQQTKKYHHTSFIVKKNKNLGEKFFHGFSVFFFSKVLLFNILYTWSYALSSIQCANKLYLIIKEVPDRLLLFTPIYLKLSKISSHFIAL